MEDKTNKSDKTNDKEMPAEGETTDAGLTHGKTPPEVDNPDSVTLP